MERLSSPSNPRVKELAALAKSPRPERFLVEGFHMVEDAYAEGCLDEVYAVEEVAFPGVKTTLLSPAALAKIAVSKHPEGILGLAHLEKKGRNGERALVLDRVQDPGNVGTLLRTAVAFDYRDVYFLPGSCSPMNPKTLSSTQGAIFKARLHFPASEEALLSDLRAEGYFLIGSALRGANPLEGVAPFPSRHALFLGNEGQGMSEKLLSSCDALLKISMSSMESLNVGVAGGILMHDLSLTKEENVG